MFLIFNLLYNGIRKGFDGGGFEWDLFVCLFVCCFVSFYGRLLIDGNDVFIKRSRIYTLVITCINFYIYIPQYYLAGKSAGGLGESGEQQKFTPEKLSTTIDSFESIK